jgi:hypothetical protein
MVRYLDPSLATANGGGRFIGSRLELSLTKKAISNKLLDTGKTCVIIGTEVPQWLLSQNLNQGS